MQTKGNRQKNAETRAFTLDSESQHIPITAKCWAQINTKADPVGVGNG